MFATSAHSRQPSFSARRKRSEKRSRFVSFVSGLVVIGIATFAGIFFAQYLGEHATFADGISRFVNRTIYDISQLNPIYLAILGLFGGMSVLVFFIRDHN